MQAILICGMLLNMEIIFLFKMMEQIFPDLYGVKLKKQGKVYYDNYNHITNFLKSLPKKRPQVTTLTTSKDLKNSSMDKNSLMKPWKIKALMKMSHHSSLERFMPCGKRKEEQDCEITPKSFPKITKRKTQIVFYICKNLGHFKLKWPGLDKEKEKKKKPIF
ncbi:hypothetical protein CR513_10324, partial [Mucuna pruriens]